MIRVASAAVLVAILVGTIWWLPWWATTAVASLAAGLAGAEVAAMAGRVGAPVPPLFAGTAAAMLAAAFALHDAGPAAFDSAALTAVLLAVVIASGLLALGSGPPSASVITFAAVAMMAPLYAGLPLGAAAWTRTAAGPAALTWLLAVIATSDSAQFYTGRLMGRRKLAPLVSPAKTVEGAIGGLAGAGLAGGLLGAIWMPEVGSVGCVLLGSALAAAGIAGDLFESMLKRSAGVKDSSHLIPGHGGMLDRIDSYLFGAPIFYLFLRYAA